VGWTTMREIRAWATMRERLELLLRDWERDSDICFFYFFYFIKEWYLIFPHFWIIWGMKNLVSPYGKLSFLASMVNRL
jgi:hypothetical protein